MLNIILIDDDEAASMSIQLFLERQSLVQQLEHYTSLGQYFENMDIARGAPSSQEIILLDIELGNINSIDHIKKIRLLNPEAKILMLSGFLSQEYLYEAIRRGASGYVLKGGKQEALYGAIQAVSSGQHYYDPQISSIITKLIFNQKDFSESPEFKQANTSIDLTLRELQVVRGLKAGQTYQEIAIENNLSINTIRHYIKTLYRKLNVNNKIQLIQKLKGFKE